MATTNFTDGTLITSEWCNDVDQATYEIVNGGNITIPGTGKRITGDFSNATVANRVMFQNATAGNTMIGATPNGSGTQAGFVAFSNSALTTYSAATMLAIDGSDIRFTSGGNSYLPMTFYTGGSERMRIDTSGVSSFGGSYASSQTTAPINVRTTNYRGNQIEFGHSNTASGYASVLGTVTGSGQPFIGLNCEAGTTGSTFRTRGMAGSVITTDNGGALIFQRVPSANADNQSTVESMRIDANGNVGVGTAPQSLGGGSTSLTIGATGNYNGLLFTSGGTTVKGSLYTNGDSGILLDASGARSLQFATNGSERMRIDANGKVGINVTPNTNVQLLIQTSGYYAAAFVNTSGASYESTYNHNTATTGDNKFVYFYTEASPTLRGGIDYNRGGSVVRYNTSSDATLKNIIGDADITKSVQLLQNTRIREYSWKDDPTNKSQIGVIAQEVYESGFKGAVSVGGDITEKDEEGNNVTKYRPWSVDKTAWTFHLVAGFQYLQQENAALKAQLAAIEARLAALEAA